MTILIIQMHSIVLLYSLIKGFLKPAIIIFYVVFLCHLCTVYTVYCLKKAVDTPWLIQDGIIVLMSKPI